MYLSCPKMTRSKEDASWRQCLDSFAVLKTTKWAARCNSRCKWFAINSGQFACHPKNAVRLILLDRVGCALSSLDCVVTVMLINPYRLSNIVLLLVVLDGHNLRRSIASTFSPENSSFRSRRKRACLWKMCAGARVFSLSAKEISTSQSQMLTMWRSRALSLTVASTPGRQQLLRSISYDV